MKNGVYTPLQAEDKIPARRLRNPIGRRGVCLYNTAIYMKDLK
jgi:hypothetical protein